MDNLMCNWVEVEEGDLAKEGDKVIAKNGKVVFLTKDFAELHNIYEPNGYGKDSYPRFRTGTL